MSLVNINLLVFANPDQARPLVDAFAQFGRENLVQGYENEKEGYYDTLPWPGLGQIQAYRGLCWEDTDVEEVIDQWVEDNQGLQPFIIVIRYQHPSVLGHSLLSWVSAPGVDAHTIGDIGDIDLPRLGSWDSPDASVLEACVPQLLAHPLATGLRSHIEGISLDDLTPGVAASRPGPRI